MQSFQGGIVRLMDTEQDPNVFLAEAVVPESALRDILSKKENFVPNVPVGFGVALEAGAAMEALQNLHLYTESQIRFSAQKSLASTAPGYGSQPPPPPVTQGEEQRALRFVVTLNTDFSKWNTDGGKQRLFLNQLALIVGVPAERIQEIKREQGNSHTVVKLTLEVD